MALGELETETTETTGIPDAASPTGPREITEEETVLGQTTGILEEGSPLLTQQETAAKEDAASRGLLNTTQAVQAGREAVISKALDIATPDAQTYATSGQSSQESSQRMEETAFTGEVSAALTEKEYGLKEDLAIKEAELAVSAAESQKNFDIAVNDASAAWDLQIRTMMEQSNFDIVAMNDLGDTTRAELSNALNQYIAESEIVSSEKQAVLSTAEDLGQQLQVSLTDISVSDLGTDAKADSTANAIEAYQSALMTAASIANIDITWDEISIAAVADVTTETAVADTAEATKSAADEFAANFTMGP